MESQNSNQVVAEDDFAAIFSDTSDFECFSNDTFRMENAFNNCCGFNRFKSLPGSYEPIPEEVEPAKDVKSPTDVVLDRIFAVDKNGFPQTSLSVYLSDKTSDDIRKFIENNILVDFNDPHFVNDEKAVAEFKKLGSDFVAECSRDRYESIEQYEERLKGIVERQDKESISARAKALRDKFFQQLKDA